jgi:SAM-dependent methyltransferase
MLAEARVKVRDGSAALVLGDCRRLPVPDAVAGLVFAAGLVPHLPDPAAGLAELGRVTRAGGKLVLFHPTGRAALAARHGRTVRPDEPLNEDNLRPLLAGAGWQLARYEDADQHFLAIGVKPGPAS